MDRKPLPPAELLRQLFSYDPETGKLTWKPRTPDQFSGSASRSAEHRCNLWNILWAGKEIINKRSVRYNGMKIGATAYYAHRVIWKMVHGEEPDTIDHINGDGFDNRLCNLRNGTMSDNMRNLTVMCTNSSGHPGVRQSHGTWQARFSQRHLGTFSTRSEAIRARQTEERRLGVVVRR